MTTEERLTDVAGILSKLNDNEFNMLERYFKEEEQKKILEVFNKLLSQKESITKRQLYDIKQEIEKTDKKQTKPKQKSIKNININVIKKTLNENEIKKIIDNNFEELREKLYIIAEQGIINEKKMMYKKYGVKMKNDKNNF
jgi:hypothetical protein